MFPFISFVPLHETGFRLNTYNLNNIPVDSVYVLIFYDSYSLCNKRYKIAQIDVFRIKPFPVTGKNPVTKTVITDEPFNLAASCFKFIEVQAVI